VKAIVGIEIEVIAVQGKAKLSQNRPGIDHDSVRDNLAQGTPPERNVAARMNDDE
jgi:predicted FMN-binding regulatory protein PaiB